MQRKIKQKKKEMPPELDGKIKDFLDMIAPSIMKSNTDYFICGNTYRCVWVLREYPTATSEQAILRHLGEKDGVTLRIYTRFENGEVAVNHNKFLGYIKNEHGEQSLCFQDYLR